jgi:hypothetical protein
MIFLKSYQNKVLEIFDGLIFPFFDEKKKRNPSIIQQYKINENVAILKIIRC